MLFPRSQWPLDVAAEWRLYLLVSNAHVDVQDRDRETTQDGATVLYSRNNSKCVTQPGTWLLYFTAVRTPIRVIEVRGSGWALA